MIRIEEALTQILSSVSPLGRERVGIMNALGRVLAEDVRSGRDIPPLDNSAMDGFAVRAADTVNAGPGHPVVLEIVEVVAAGSLPRETIAPGKASRIMTGAPIPGGADAVVRHEDTREAEGVVKILAPVAAGLDVRRAGEDVRRDDLVMGESSLLRPAEIGMLASLGRSVVSVYQRPRVAVISTGDELVEIDEDPSSWKIVNSNSYALAAQVAECGAEPVLIGIARDRRDDLEKRFREASRTDLILSSGGVSVGDYDFVKDVMQEVGNRMQFWRVAMRPGRPLAFGFLGGVPFFGLPGNPVSSMVTFEQFVRPAILKMMGHRKLYRRAIRASLAGDVMKKRGLRYFIRVHVRREGDRYIAAPTGDQGSGILRSMVLANGLVVLPPDVEEVHSGDVVTVQILDVSLQLTETPEYL